jgi:Protein of unknown function (DUF2490)
MSAVISNRTNAVDLDRAPGRVHNPRGRFWLALCFLTVCCPLRSPAQMPPGGAESSTWLSYFGDQPFTNKLALHLEGSYRATFLLDHPEQYMLRSGLTVEHGHGLSSLFAYTYLVSYPFEGGTLSPASASGKQREHRAFEQLQFEHSLIRLGEKYVTLTHRFRLEQRFLGTATEGVGVMKWKFGERARYRLTAKIPIKNAPWPIVPNYVSVFDEVYTSFGPHSGNTPFYANVDYGAFGWNLGSMFAFELGYQHRYAPKANGVIGQNDNELQLMLLSTGPIRRFHHHEQ